MTRHSQNNKRLSVLLGLLTALLLTSTAPTSVCAGRRVTFDNQSSQPALVKLIGPVSATVEVPDEAMRTVQASGGHYFIHTHYVTGESTYRYSKGEHLDITETFTGFFVPIPTRPDHPARGHQRELPHGPLEQTRIRERRRCEGGDTVAGSCWLPSMWGRNRRGGICRHATTFKDGTS
ncbi:MAG: hypothetical protein MRJ68_11770 [Nitrospira sp.]|nr:hypothetical protein [Nitrospira sp.]